MSIYKKLISGFCISLLFLSMGCSVQPIKPWVKPYQRDKLADPLMSLETNPLDDPYLSHVYQSREAARGAEGTGGGGCGCN